MVSAYFNTPPANELDERIAAGLLLLSGLTPDIKDPKDGVTIPPFRPQNYHFETKGPGIIAGLSVCMVIVTIVTFTRLSIRLFVRECRFGLDDWLIIPAYLLAMAYPALQIAMVVYGGAGKHFYDITYQEYFHYKYLAPTSTTCFYVYVGVVKMSIASFNIRLTSISSRFWKHVNYAFFGLCLAYTIAALFLNIFKCNPPFASFNLLAIADSGRVPKCLSVNDMNSILRLNLALDFTALAIPVIVIWKVQMSWEKKARLFALLSIGLIACIASVMTLVSQFTLAKDPLWNYTTLLAWIMVELVVSIIAASAPTLAYLLPRSMVSQHPSNNASKTTDQRPGPSYGLGSRLSKHEYRLRTRPINGEDADSEEEERRIIVKEDIEMKWQGGNGSGSTSQAGDNVDGNSSMTSWYDENNPKSSTVIYDGRDPGHVTRTWVSAAEMSTRRVPARGSEPGRAI